MNWRRSITFPADAIDSVSVADRSSLESLINHRALGYGTHNGSKRPGRRRVGTMLGRGVVGKQFWSVREGGGAMELVVLDLLDHEFVRAVLEVDDAQACWEVVAAASQA